MTIGLVLLAIISVLLFFGVAEPYFDKLGITSWLAFLLTLALIIGSVMPEIKTDTLVITISGFIMPLAVGVIIAAMAFKYGDALRCSLGIILVSMTTVAFRLIITPDTQAMLIAYSIVTGIVGGAVAYMSAGTRIGVIAAAILGSVVGDLAASAVRYGIFKAETFVIGGTGIFDVLVIAAVVGTTLCIVVDAVRNGIEGKRAAKQYSMAEVAEDIKADKETDKENGENKKPPENTGSDSENYDDEWVSDDNNGE